MLLDEKPPLDEDLLAHFGVKGMHWGQRKEKASSAKPKSAQAQMNARLARRRVIADRTTKGVLIVGGAAAAYMVFRRGSTPVNRIPRGSMKVPNFDRVVSRASKMKASQVRVADQALWKKSVDAVLKDMKSANDEQDAWMRSMGLGAAVNNR